MNIDEAAKYLEVILAAPETANFPKPKEAISLGIEALKAIQRRRRGFRLNLLDLLKGETKE